MSKAHTEIGLESARSTGSQTPASATSVSEESAGTANDQHRELVAALAPRSHVRIIIPNRDSNDCPIDHSALWAAAVGWFTAVGGGTTSIPAWGTWVKDARTVAVERVYVVESFLPDRFEVGQRLAIVGWLVEFAKRARQHALAVSIDGRLFLIESPEAAREGGVS